MTPHTITIVAEDGNTIAVFPSEGVARATQQSVHAFNIDGVEVVKMAFGEPVGLPAPEEGGFLVVSIITANAARAYGRTTDDLLVTANPVRDDEGRIIGCRNLAQV